MKTNLYLAGKVKVNNYRRDGGWRARYIKEIFGVDVDVASGDYDTIDFFHTNINDEFDYVGAYLYGCDHGCSHREPTAHGVITCSSSVVNLHDGEDSRIKVRDVSMAAIREADVLIVNFEDFPLDTYGTYAEVGYAYALGKTIYGVGEFNSELWFVQSLCMMSKDIPELIEKHFYMFG